MSLNIVQMYYVDKSSLSMHIDPVVDIRKGRQFDTHPTITGASWNHTD